MENLKNLEKIAKIFQPQNIITSEEIDQVLKGIMEILATYKKGTDAINEETKTVVNILLDKVVQSNKQTLDKAEVVLDGRMKEVETLLSGVKQMMTDVETFASTLEDGKDADEEKIVEDVINRIKIDPVIVSVSAEEVRDKLSSLKDENRLDKSAIKGLDKIIFQKDLDYAIATLQQQTSFLINRGGLKNVTAGTNVTIDYTDPSNPIISSSGGGGGGSPGGSTTQLQYNNAGSFGGITGATTNGTAITYTTGNLIGADVKASDSGGLQLLSNTGTVTALFGAGGGANSTLYGGTKLDYATASTIAILDASKNLISADTATYPSLTELSYVKGVTSAIQTQINAKFTLPSLTAGSILFSDGSTIAQDNSSLFFDDTNNRLGLLTTAPTHTLTMGSTGTGIALYNTSDQTTNYERGLIQWSGNQFNIRSGNGGTGTNRPITIGATNSVLTLQDSGTSRVGIAFATFGASATSIIPITGTLNGASLIPNVFAITPTISQSSTAGYTALLVNPTESTTGSGTKLLADFQVGGTSRFNIANTGITTITNSTDATPNQILNLKGARATPAANDEIYQSFSLNSSTGVTRELGRIVTRATTVTNGSEASRMDFYVATSGTLAGKLILSGGTLAPFANDGITLGTGTLSYADLFLATGGVINWNNGNATLTHSTGLLTSSVPIVAPQIVTTPATVTVTTNAGTVTRANRINNFTNSSAATMAITLSTTGALDGDMLVVRIFDFSAATQTIGWTNTENSTVTAPTTSNGSTTLPLTVGFQYNSATSKWRCIASA